MVGQWTPGRVCYRSAEGAVRRLHTGFNFPNGIGLDPDGRTLVVAESIGGKLHAFDVRAPGVLGPPRELAFLGTGMAPDGLAFDAEGNVLVAAHGSGKIFVVPPQGGRPARTLDLEDSHVTNLCFGGPDLRTLYVTEAGLGRVVALQWDVPGLPLRPDRVFPRDARLR